jgi:hypothetical protein
MPLYKENYTWVNEHKNVQFMAMRLYDLWNRNSDGSRPPTLKDRWDAGIARIKDALSDAEAVTRQLGIPRRVRAVGAGWSLSEAQKTTDYLIATQALNIVWTQFDRSYILDPFEPGNQVLVQCGAGVWNVNATLAKEGLCLKTSGASDGQTMAGAISTGTHGAAINVGAMPDYVKALHIITASNKEYWIEGDTKVVTDKFLQYYVPNAQRINSDSTLGAAVVSFGSFGIVHAILIEAEPLYYLEEWQDYFPWAEVNPLLVDPRKLGDYFNAKKNANLDPAKLHHVQVVVNPYVTQPDDTVTLKIMYKHPGAPPPQPPLPHDYGQNEDLANFLGTATDILTKASGTIPFIMRNLIDGALKASYSPLAGYFGKPGDLFSGGIGRLRPKGLSIEMGFQASQTQKAFDILLRTAMDIQFPGFVGIRYVKGSTATLAFTKFDMTSTIEIQSPYAHETLLYYDEALARLEEVGITVTLHWGQCNDYYTGDGAAKIRRRWGNDRVDAWIAARNSILTTQELRDRFSNELTANCGLS